MIDMEKYFLEHPDIFQSFRYTCEPGLVFDDRIKTCNWAAEVDDYCNAPDVAKGKPITSPIVIEVEQSRENIYHSHLKIFSCLARRGLTTPVPRLTDFSLTRSLAARATIFVTMARWDIVLMEEKSSY